MDLNKSLSDIEKILSEHKTLKEYIDETGGVFVLASTLLALLVAPNAAAAFTLFGFGTDVSSYKFSKLFDWLPEKLNYWNKGKGVIVVERYEKALLVNMMIFHIAIREGIKKTMLSQVTAYHKAIEKFYSSGIGIIMIKENNIKTR